MSTITKYFWATMHYGGLLLLFLGLAIHANYFAKDLTYSQVYMVNFLCKMIFVFFILNSGAEVLIYYRRKKKS